MLSLGKLSLHAWYLFAFTYKDSTSGFCNFLHKYTEHIYIKAREFQNEN